MSCCRKARQRGLVAEGRTHTRFCASGEGQEGCVKDGETTHPTRRQHPKHHRCGAAGRLFPAAHLSWPDQEAKQKILRPSTQIRCVHALKAWGRSNQASKPVGGLCLPHMLNETGPCASCKVQQQAGLQNSATNPTTLASNGYGACPTQGSAGPRKGAPPLMILTALLTTVFSSCSCVVACCNSLRSWCTPLGPSQSCVSGEAAAAP